MLLLHYQAFQQRTVLDICGQTLALESQVFSSRFVCVQCVILLQKVKQKQ